MTYAVREAMKAYQRTPLLAALSVLAIALSLFVVGLFALTAFNIRRAIEGIEERVEVVAYLRDDAPTGEINRAIHELAAMPGMRQIHYVSKDEALVTAVQELPEFRNVFLGLDANPLPASLEIRLRPGYRNPESLDHIAQRLSAYPVVEQVSFGRDWVAKIVSLRRIAGGATTIIGGAFALVAGIIIATAVRLAVFARREEIEIMRLVGAHDGFIQRPFLVEGLLSGLAGGVLAVVLTFAAFAAVDAGLMRLAWLPDSWALLGIGAGAVYGLLSSAVAVRRHLRAV
ncbi:MAG TPA: permease-like cell division protein FtsX [Longimicrobiaceae bacterium]|nr:permease-like cell division protein FtsX [Longimicrobiaceae bacterium]